MKRKNVVSLWALLVAHADAFSPRAAIFSKSYSIGRRLSSTGDSALEAIENMKAQEIKAELDMRKVGTAMLDACCSVVKN